MISIAQIAPPKALYDKYFLCLLCVPHVPPISSSALSQSQVYCYEITVIHSSRTYLLEFTFEFIRQQVTLSFVTSSGSRGSVAGCSSSYFKVFKDFCLLARILDPAARIKKKNLKIISDQQHAVFAHELHSTLELKPEFSNNDFELWQICHF